MARRLSVAFGCWALAVLVLGATAGVGASPPSKRAGASVVIVGGSRAQRQLARLTALRVGGVTIRRVVFQRPSRVLRREHVRGVELVVSSAGEQTVRAEWEQQLYVGAYLGLMGRWPHAAVAAAASDQTQGPVSRLRPYEVFGSNPRTAAVQRELVPLSAAASRHGARVVELRVAATPARTIALTLRVSDPAAFLKRWALPVLGLLERPRIPLLGYYLGVQNASGRLVFATSRLPDTGAVFVIPSLDACSPVGHTELALHQPPPCPAR